MLAGDARNAQALAALAGGIATQMGGLAQLIAGNSTRIGTIETEMVALQLRVTALEEAEDEDTYCEVTSTPLWGPFQSITVTCPETTVMFTAGGGND